MTSHEGFSRLSDLWMTTWSSLSTDDHAIGSVLHHHPDHLVHDPAPTPGGEDDFTHEEVLLKGLFAGRSGGLDVTLSHGRGCFECALVSLR
jgi:hypothetical protein